MKFNSSQLVGRVFHLASLLGNRYAVKLLTCHQITSTNRARIRLRFVSHIILSKYFYSVYHYNVSSVYLNAQGPDRIDLYSESAVKKKEEASSTCISGALRLIYSNTCCLVLVLICIKRHNLALSARMTATK